MLPLKFFEVYDESEIRNLKSGPIRGRRYQVALLKENSIIDVFDAHLQNNFQSQCMSLSYPTGYLAFRIQNGISNFDIQRSKFEMRRVDVWTNAKRKNICGTVEKVDAVILKRPLNNSELSLLLKYVSDRTWLKERIRQAVASVEILEVAGRLLQESVLGRKPAEFGAVTRGPTFRFGFYLNLAQNQILNQLLSLIQSESNNQPVAPAA